MDTRRLADLSDDEILAEMHEQGLVMDAENCGHPVDAAGDILRSVADDFEPL